MQNLAPIVLFVYNRPDHTKQTIEALSKNHLAKESILYIFSDGPKSRAQEKKVNEVRQLINKFKNKDLFKEVNIVESAVNKGLAQSIIAGVTQVINEHKKVIVLEDDLITSTFFLQFMNSALTTYKDSKFGAISGYNPLKDINIPNDCYITNRSCSYGWGTWDSIWNQVDWNPQHHPIRKEIIRSLKFGHYGLDRVRRLDKQLKPNSTSWSIKFGLSIYYNDLLVLYPSKSFIKNIGWDHSGSNQSKNEEQNNQKFNFELSNQMLDVKNINYSKNKDIQQGFFYLYSASFLNRIKTYTYIILSRIWNKLNF